jgi:hypothetical protein
MSVKAMALRKRSARALGVAPPRKRDHSKDTEDDIIAFVQNYGKYYGGDGYRHPPFYAVTYEGRTYCSDDTRDLVVRICRENNIPVQGD